MISVITPTIRPESLADMRESLMKQTFKDFEWLVDINITGEHDLNASFNKLIKRASGELIVFLEDYTIIKEDGLQKFWDAYQMYPDTCFTAPLGKVLSFADENPAYDWRIDKEEINSRECELDWGAIPKKILMNIGGFDERLDQWWSFDNVSVGIRAEKLGYKFKCIKDNPALAIDHDKIIKHPFRDKYKPSEVNRILNDYESNPVLKYML